MVTKKQVKKLKDELKPEIKDSDKGEYQALLDQMNNNEREIFRDCFRAKVNKNINKYHELKLKCREIYQKYQAV